MGLKLQTENIQKTSLTPSKRLLHVQFTSFAQGKSLFKDDQFLFNGCNYFLWFLKTVKIHGYHLYFPTVTFLCSSNFFKALITFS